MLLWSEQAEQMDTELDEKLFGVIGLMSHLNSRLAGYVLQAQELQGFLL